MIQCIKFLYSPRNLLIRDYAVSKGVILFYMLKQSSGNGSLFMAWEVHWEGLHFFTNKIKIPEMRTSSVDTCFVNNQLMVHQSLRDVLIIVSQCELLGILNVNHIPFFRWLSEIGKWSSLINLVPCKLNRCQGFKSSFCNFHEQKGKTKTLIWCGSRWV